LRSASRRHGVEWSVISRSEIAPRAAAFCGSVDVGVGKDPFLYCFVANIQRSWRGPGGNGSALSGSSVAFMRAVVLAFQARAETGRTRRRTRLELRRSRECETPECTRYGCYWRDVFGGTHLVGVGASGENEAVINRGLGRLGVGKTLVEGIWEDQCTNEVGAPVMDVDLRDLGGQRRLRVLSEGLGGG